MTRDQLHIAFKIAMDKNSKSIAFGGCPAFLPDEIDYWLNQGLYQEINTKFTGNNAMKIAFEGSVKRTHDLESLIKTRNIAATKETNTNVCYVDKLFNDERMFFVDAALNFGSNKANVKLVTHADAQKFKMTHSNNPWIDIPVGTIHDNRLNVYYDNVSMKADSYTIDITYVKVPKMVNETYPSAAEDELPEYMWYEIVNRAVELALEDIESRRVQTKTQLNQLDE